MSLLLAASEAELCVKIRNRIAEGAAVREVPPAEIPAWFAEEIGDEAVQAVFESEYAVVAILESGKQVVRRVPCNF